MKSSQPFDLQEQLGQVEQIEALEPVYELLENLISQYGTTGIGAAMFAESAGVPFASVIVLMTAGTMILRGSVSFWSLLIASTLGLTLGSVVSYILGLLGRMVGTAVRSGFSRLTTGPKRYTSNANKPKLLQLWEKYGNFSIFMAQLWGVSRTFGSFPAGAMHMNFFFFIIYTFLGGTLF
ncbi:MAG: DedA family protein, partial [Bacillota bacterium]